MKFQCTVLKPRISPWFAIDADTAAEAADALIDQRPDLAHFTYTHDAILPNGVGRTGGGGSGRETVTFYLVLVEGHGEFVVRRYHAGLYRRGGVKPHSGDAHLKRIADDLGWEGKPEELLESGWDLEEGSWT